MPTTVDPEFVAVLTESLKSLAGPRSGDRAAAYGKAIAAAITAHPAVISYLEGLREVAEKAQRVDASRGGRSDEFDKALRDLHDVLDRVLRSRAGSAR